VGLVLVAGIAVAALSTLFLKGYDWRGSLTTVDAVFAEAGQLMVGSPVKVRGVEIGKVEEIAVEPSGEAVRVRLRVRRDVTLPADPVVLLSPESLFGDWKAEIVSRALFPRYPYMASPESGTLPGYALPDISRLTAAADEIAQNLTVLTDRVELAFTEETAMNLKAAIDNIGSMSSELSTLVTKQAESFEGVAREVELAARSARTSFEGVNRVLGDGTADTLIGDARVAMQNFGEASQRLNGTMARLDEAITSADSTFARLDRIGADLESGSGSLGRLFSDTTLATRAEDALLQLSALLADFQANPKRYVRLSIF